MKFQTQEKILNLLLSGRHPKAKKYAGHHVLVIGDQILPLKEGEKAIKDIERLERKYGRTPTIVFIPRQDISYSSQNPPSFVWSGCPESNRDLTHPMREFYH